MSRKFHTHSYPVSRNEAIEIGLPVAKDSDKKLEDLLWKAWINIEADLNELRLFCPLREVVNSPEGSKLLSPIPQIDVAATASSSAATSAGIKPNSPSIDPVDFEVKNAIVDSSRAGRTCVTKGKILAYRTPKLQINYNAVKTQHDWDEMK